MVRVASYVMAVSIGLVAPVMAEDAKASGEKVFADQKCSLCHSIAGKGNAKGPLDAVGSKLKADEIRAWITDAKGMTAKTKPERKPEMKAFDLPKDDVDALVAYLSALKKSRGGLHTYPSSPRAAGGFDGLSRSSEKVFCLAQTPRQFDP
jgi:mono/diheme cytochrome c family protein